jgi:hypothetical protein
VSGLYLVYTHILHLSPQIAPLMAKPGTHVAQRHQFERGCAFSSSSLAAYMFMAVIGCAYLWPAIAPF